MPYAKDIVKRVEKLDPDLHAVKQLTFKTADGREKDFYGQSLWATNVEKKFLLAQPIAR